MALRSWAGPMRAEEVQALLDQVRELRDGRPARRGGRRAARGRAAPGRRSRPGRRRTPPARRSVSARASASSHWSTTSTAPVPLGAWARTSSGWAPGVTIRTRRPSRTRAAATPARISEDLPLPDGPTTARTPAASSRRQARRHVRLAPEERRGVVDVVGDQPQVGADRRWRPASAASARSAGSCRRIASSSSASCGPGSSPNSLTMMVRARWRVSSASAWRPAWYCARASRPHRRSRVGSWATMRCSSPSTSSWRPARIAASACRSSASRRRSPRRSDSIRPASHSASRSSGSPRHRCRASPAGVAGPVGLARGEQLARPQQQVLEAQVVDVVPVQGQPVAGAGGHDRVGPQGLAQAGDAALHDLGPGRREPFTPQRLARGPRPAPSRRAARPVPPAPPGRAVPAGSVPRRLRAGRARQCAHLECDPLPIPRQRPRYPADTRPAPRRYRHVRQRPWTRVPSQHSSHRTREIDHVQHQRTPATTSAEPPPPSRPRSSSSVSRPRRPRRGRTPGPPSSPSPTGATAPSSGSGPSSSAATT